MAFLQALKKLRGPGLREADRLAGYLYQTARFLAISYWRGEGEHKERQYRSQPRGPMTEVPSLSLEEQLDEERIAECVRALMETLPLKRDRRVLERLYIKEESREVICESMSLTEGQFNNVLWRARQRFGEILRKHGFDENGRCGVLRKIKGCLRKG